MDLDKFKRKWGKLNIPFPLTIDAETKLICEEIEAFGFEIPELSREILIPELRKIHAQLKGTQNG